MYNILTLLVKESDTLALVKTRIIHLLNKIDSDWSGENGDEYLDEDAEAAGFTTNNEYYVESFLKSTEADAIVDFLKLYFEANSYFSYETKIDDVSDDFNQSCFFLTFVTAAKHPISN